MAALFTKLLSQTDINHRFSVPTANLEDFEIPKGEHAICIQVIDTTDQQWYFRLSIRLNDDPNPRPVFTGAWSQFVSEKGLKVGDRISMYRQEDEKKGVQYRIRAERKIFNVWVNVE